MRSELRFPREVFLQKFVLGVSFFFTIFYAQNAMPETKGDSEPVTVQGSCDADEYDAHKFRVGKWTAINPDTNEKVGIQEVRQILNGCAYEVSWNQLNDQFRKPGSSYRYAAHGIIALKKGVWTQSIADNGGGVFITSGGVDDRGVFFDSMPNEMGVIYRTYVSEHENGVLWNEAYVREGEDSDWVSLWRLRYDKTE